MNSLEHMIGMADAGIVRVKQTSAGLIVEADGIGKAKGYAAHVYETIEKIAWEAEKEIIYSLIVYSSKEERFAVEAILREQPTTYSFNMSTSILGANDVFCRFTKFDFEVLTLANRDSKSVGYFTIDEYSPCKEPLIAYKELDIQGFQYQILSKARKQDGYYEIELAGDEVNL